MSILAGVPQRRGRAMQLDELPNGHRIDFVMKDLASQVVELQTLARISLFGRRSLVGILKAVGAPHPTAVDAKAGVFLPAPFYAVAEFSDFRLDASCLEKARALLALEFVRAYYAAGPTHCARVVDRRSKRALGLGSRFR